MGRAVLDLVISYSLSTNSVQSSALAARDTAKMRACLPSRCWQSIHRWENGKTVLGQVPWNQTQMGVYMRKFIGQYDWKQILYENEESRIG